MSKPNFFQELKRRNVYKVAITYVVVAWLIMQVAAIVLPAIKAPDWPMQFLLFFLAIGFPIALILAWAFEMSPEGIIPTTSVEAAENPYPDHKKKPLTSKVAIGVLVLALVGQFVYNKYWDSNPSDSDIIQNVVVASIDKSIAVLPFKNDSPDKDNQYFCDGMMGEILNHLQKIAELGVKSRTAVEIYRDSPKSFAAIAGELDVAYILEGAVRKYGENFRITTQLIEVKSGNHLWSETYDGIFSDTIFVVQSNIAKKVASSMSALISAEVEARIDLIPTTNVAAYDLYIKAEYERWTYMRTWEDNHLKKAQTLFSQALQIDPDYLLAVVGKGQAFNLQSKPDSGLVYADRAIALDPQFNRSYGMKGYSYFGKGEADLALEYWLKAISLPPQDDWWFSYHVAIGQHYIWRKNEVIKALPYLRKSIEKKESQYVSQGYLYVCQAYIAMGDYQTAQQYLAKNLDVSCLVITLSYQLMTIQGNFKAALESTDSLCQLAECQANCASAMFEASVLLGEFKEAEQYFFQLQDAVANLDPSLFKNIMTGYLTEAGSIYLAYVYKQLGRTEEAEKVFAEHIKILQSSDNRYAYYDLSKIYAFQGDKKQSLKYLAEYAKRGFAGGRHDFILIDPFFESLRDDPEFQAIVKQAQEEKAALRAQVREMEKRGELDL